jgi:hypothetical protein
VADAEMKEVSSASSAVPLTAWAVVGLMYPSRPIVCPDSSSSIIIIIIIILVY